MTGVISGDAESGGETIAILRGQKGAGADERRFVKIGDDVGNGYVVASISRGGIVLKLQQKGEKDKIARIEMGSIGGNRGTETHAPPVGTAAAGTAPTGTSPVVPAAARQGG